MSGLEKLVLYRYLTEEVKTGEPIASLVEKDKVEIFQEQEGDIPALYQFDFEGLPYHLSCLEGIIVHISVKLDYEPSLHFQFGEQSKAFEFGFHSSFQELVDFLNCESIPWAFDSTYTGDQSLDLIVSSKTHVLYCFDKEFTGCFQVYYIDKEKYEALAKLSRT